ncbi:MAG: hypothetical protein ACRC2W_07550 [Plesiomonas shigelloides]
MDLQNNFENPYPNTIQCIVSEMLQLLLVVERIKSDKEAAQRLRSIAHIYSKFDEIKDISLSNYSFSSQENNAQRLLCSVLDQGLDTTSFLMKGIQLMESLPRDRAQARRGEENKLIGTWIENVSAVIDSEQYRFENLNLWRLHYPHLQIALAYLNGEKLLKLVIRLNSIDFKHHIDVAKEKVDKEYSYIFDEKVSSVNRAIILEQHVVSQAIEDYIKTIRSVISDVERCLKWSFKEGKSFTRPKVKKEKKEWKGFSREVLVDQSVLSFDILESEVKTAVDNGELDLISHIITNSLASVVKQEMNVSDYTDGHEYWVGLFDIYEHYARLSNRVQLLSHADDDLKIKYEVLLRGIGFSVWRESVKSKGLNEKAVLKLIPLYLAEKEGIGYCFGKATTIKQSYEEVKGYSKRSKSKAKPSRLVSLIHSQMTIRLLISCPRACFVFAPFNISYEDKVKSVAKELSVILDKNKENISYGYIHYIFEKKGQGLLLEDKTEPYFINIQDVVERKYNKKPRLMRLLEEDILVMDNFD